MKIRSKITSLLIIIIFIFISTLVFSSLANAAVQFTDVPSNHWARIAIYDLVERGIVAGIGDGKFGTKSNVTRAQFSKFIVQATGKTFVPWKGTFSDVPNGKWYSGWVEAAVENGFMSGKGAGRFDPDGNITRQEMAVGLANVISIVKQTSLEDLGSSTTLAFSDNQLISSWAIPGIKVVVGLDLMKGSNNTFRPKMNSTRAEAAMIIYLLINSDILSSTNTPGSSSNPVPTPGELTTQEIAKESEHIGMIITYDQNNKPISQGSGVIISSDGKVITNYHVIDKAYSAKITLDNGLEFNFSGVLSYNVKRDIAILKIDSAATFKFADLGDSSTIQLGDKVIAVGNPEGLANTVSEGIISTVSRLNPDGYYDIQISAPIAHGSSGGGLFDVHAKLIGITYAGLETIGDLGFAIPINDVKSMININDLKTFQQVYSEVNPQTSYSQIENYLNANYRSINAYDTYNWELGPYNVYQPEGEPDRINIFVTMDADQYIQLLYILSDENNGHTLDYNKALINSKMLEIYNYVKDMYPEKDVSFGLYFSDWSEAYPSEYFDTEYITWDSEMGAWWVFATRLFIYEDPVNGLVSYWWFDVDENTWPF